MTDANFPTRGAIFWTVGTGDSSTIVIDDEHVLQVDLHDMAKADEDDAVCTPVVDHLADKLPKRDDKPYLAAFALTHGDQDHCRGLGDLLDSDVVIGELWATPRLWREYAEDGDEAQMCEDAKRFHEEANRRVKATLDHIAAGRAVPSGDRIRVIGYDTDLHELDYAYAALPDDNISFPGDAVGTIDDEDVSDVFEVFIHAPFKDDCAAERNDTSLAMQVTLKDGETTGRLLLLGDLAYATLRKIFDISDADTVGWDVLLAPHHCSKKAMYVSDELKQDILDDLDTAAGVSAYVVSSSDPVPASNKPGDNPPHALAKARYQELGIVDFLCTQEHGSVKEPKPVVFALVAGVGLELESVEDAKGAGATTLSKIVAGAAAAGAVGVAAAAVRRARRAETAPAKPVGFGRR
jgi:hypothetical protein